MRTAAIRPWTNYPLKNSFGGFPIRVGPATLFPAMRVKIIFAHVDHEYYIAAEVYYSVKLHLAVLMNASVSGSVM